MNLAVVMDAVAGRLGAIAGLRVAAYPDGKVEPPAAIVAMPTQMDFDETYGRGSDKMTLNVVVLVSGAVPRAARNALSDYGSGSGPASVKAVLESGAFTAFDDVQVNGWQYDIYTVGGVAYPALIFDLVIVGKGA